MSSFIQEQIIFYFALILVLFLPGYFFILLIEAKRKLFSSFERFAISSGFSIAIVTFLMILMGRMGISINRINTLVLLISFTLICYLIRNYLKKRHLEKNGPAQDDSLFSFSKDQKIILVVLLFLTIFIKTIYLSDAIFPSATDLGHHTYWIQKIATDGKLPEYSKTDIVQTDSRYEISKPEPIPDFIVGEHLVFAAIVLITGDEAVSVYPTIVLFLINIMGILAVFILAFRLFGGFPWGKNAALLALFAVGPLYAISSAQAKFVSGGVVGNILGNFLIPLALYFFWRSVREKKSSFMLIAIFLAFSLFYTHHLSALIFSLTISGFILIYAALNLRRKKESAESIRFWIKLFLNPRVMGFIILLGIFFFFVYTPSYIETNAVDTIVGSPTKSTKQGYSFTNISYLTGEARMVLGIIGTLILLFFIRKNKQLTALLLSWIGVIFIMSWKPGWIHLNIPSARVANYLAFPISVSAGAAIAWIFHSLKNHEAKKRHIPEIVAISSFVFIFAFIIASGFYDNSQSLKTSGTNDAIKTFHAGKFLAQKTNSQDMILKDHNYILSDSWIKVFFMKDYNYPLTRSFFFRYTENSQREHCTLWMIESPESDDAQKCFNDIGVNFIMVNPAYDSVQFQKLPEFSKIYDSEKISIYNRR